MVRHRSGVFDAAAPVAHHVFHHQQSPDDGEHETVPVTWHMNVLGWATTGASFLASFWCWWRTSSCRGSRRIRMLRNPSRIGADKQIVTKSCRTPRIERLSAAASEEQRGRTSSRGRSSCGYFFPKTICRWSRCRSSRAGGITTSFGTRGEQEATALVCRITTISTDAEHRGIHTPRAEEDPWCRCTRADALRSVIGWTIRRIDCLSVGQVALSDVLWMTNVGRAAARCSHTSAGYKQSKDPRSTV